MKGTFAGHLRAKCHGSSIQAGDEQVRWGAGSREECEGHVKEESRVEILSSGDGVGVKSNLTVSCSSAAI
eukprot:746335-Hanusia_phi.AAC.2